MTMANAHLQADLESQRYAMRSYSTTAKVLHWLTVALVVFMVTSAVVAKQLNDGPWSDTLFMLHKTTGLLTLAVVLLRVCYRVVQWWREPQPASRGRPVLHWMLYGMVIVVPLLGWAGISAFGSLEIMPGFSVPAIWPKNEAQSDVIFMVHAYLAFTMLALVALHIGMAMQDYMMRADEPDRRN